jgi:hypothetical protein
MNAMEQFLNSGRSTLDLGQELQDEVLTGNAGRIYLDGLWIEDTSNWPEIAPGYKKGRWYTIIGRNEYQGDDLGAIEKILFDFASSEGYFH